MTEFSLELMASDLKSALAACRQVTDSGVKIPVLKTTKIVVSDSSASFTATNLDHAIRMSVPASGDGEVNLDTETLASKSAVLDPNKPVKFVGDGNFVSISQGRSRWKMPIIASYSFPDVIRAPETHHAVELHDDFLDKLARVSVACDPADKRPEIAGVLLDAKDGLTLAATDGKAFFAEPVEAQAESNCTIPIKSVRAILSIFKGAEIVSAAWDARALSITHGGLTYWTKLIESPFPDWRRFSGAAMKGSESRATVGREELLAAVNAASAIKIDVAGVKIDMTGAELIAKCSNRDGEEGVGECACDGDDGQIGVGISLLTEALNSLSGEKVDIQFGEMTGVKITESGADGAAFRLLMPMRV